MNWLRRLAKNRLLDVGVAVIALVCVGKIALMLPAQITRDDFAHYYVASRVLMAGENPYTSSLAPAYARYGFEFSEDVPTATNTPFFLRAFGWLARMGVRPAFWAWIAVQVVSLGIILRLTRSLLGQRLSARGWRFLCLAAVCSSTVYWHLYFSQLQLLLAAIVLAAYALHRSGRPTGACLMLTLAALLKLYPAALLPWFVWRGATGGRERLKLVAQVLIFAAAGVVLTGVGKWLDLFHYGASVLAGCSINHTFNINVPSFVVNLGYIAYDFAPPETVRWLCWAAGSAASLVILLAAYAPCLGQARDIEAEFCLLNVAMLAASARASGHYEVFLIFPLAAAAVRVAGNPAAGRLIAFVLMLAALDFLPTVASPWLDRHLYAKLLLNNIPLGGLVGLGVFFACELRARADGPLPEPADPARPCDPAGPAGRRGR